MTNRHREEEADVHPIRNPRGDIRDAASIVDDEERGRDTKEM
jgi:hypothetical protein